MNIGLIICALLFVVCLIVVMVDIATHKSDNNYTDDFYSAELNTENTSEKESIYEFKELLDMGAITQEEFERKKKELLDI